MALTALKAVTVPMALTALKAVTVQMALIALAALTAVTEVKPEVVTNCGDIGYLAQP